jgi:hypothetical protein
MSKDVIIVARYGPPAESPTKWGDGEQGKGAARQDQRHDGTVLDKHMRTPSVDAAPKVGLRIRPFNG